MAPHPAALAALLLATPPAATQPGWKAGFGKAVITPPSLMWMSGYGARTAPAEGTESDLYARAMALETPDGSRAVLVALDLVGVDRGTSRAVCDAVVRKHNLPREALILNCSHTHCGPVVGTNLQPIYDLGDDQRRLVEEYTRELPGKVLKAVDDAVAGLGPVTLGRAVGRAGFAVNRRENKEAEVPALRKQGAPLKGPVDHDVPVLAARGPDGTLKGVVFSYACHATVLGFQKWCGDYPGYAAAELEQAHPGATALFFAGCGADQNPLPRRTVELAKAYGRRLATAVDEVLDQPMTPVPPQWAGVYNQIQLPLAEVPSREAILKDAESTSKYVAARAKYLLKKLESGEQLPAAYPYPVQAWRLGPDLTVAFLGGEVVVDYALRLKRELGPDQWVMGYCNDVMAYIPSLRVLKEGGYEGATSMLPYGLPSVWGPRIEELIVAEVHRAARAVRRK